MNSIGNKICNLRKQNNMSQEQLAEKLNVSRQSISKWERDEALPDIFNLEALSDVFNVTIDSIVKKDEHINVKAITPKSTMPFLDDKSIKTNLIIATSLSVFFFIIAYIFCYVGDYYFMEETFLPNAVGCTMICDKKRKRK